MPPPTPGTSKEGDSFDDDVNTTLDMDITQEIFYEEDNNSVEIPPTKVVQNYASKELDAVSNGGGGGSSGDDDDGSSYDKKKRSAGIKCGNNVYIGIVLCLTLSIAIILGVGFGTGSFLTSSESSDDKQQSSSSMAANNAEVSGIAGNDDSITVVVKPKGTNTNNKGNQDTLSAIDIGDGTILQYPSDPIPSSNVNEIGIGDGSILNYPSIPSTPDDGVATTTATIPKQEQPQTQPQTPVTAVSTPAIEEIEQIVASPQEIELQNYVAKMKEFLSLIATNKGRTFDDPNAPESLAQQFLSLEDPLRLDPANRDQQWRIQQRYALMTLWYQSGPTWTVRDSWLLDSDECKWHGIGCNSLGEVEYISLESNNMYGRIPDDLALLATLTSINLADNFLQGSIPSSLEMLTQLQEIYLDRNFLTGLLSAFNFTPLTQLTILDVSSNDLRGPIPETIYDLQALQYLILDNNQLDGRMSNSVAKLSNTLERLTLSNNQLTGRIVPAVGQLVNLQVLWLFNNSFTGPLFTEELENLQNLAVFDVVMNELSGGIPTEFGSMASLQYLNLGKNKFTGRIPYQFPPQMVIYNVEDNLLTGDIPVDISYYNLTTLRVGNNALRLRNNGRIPRFIFNMESLTDLRLNGIGYGGLLDTDMEYLTNLEVLHLQENEFNDNFPDRILNSIGANLKYLDLSSNNLGGNLPDYLDEMVPNMEHLDVSNNNFDGNLPNGLTILKNLAYLDASSNTFGGDFPRFGSQSYKLEHCDLSTNNLGGTLPPTIGNLLELTHLDVSANRLTGTIPEETTGLFKLKVLNLGFNFMRGEIPQTIGDMKYLEELRLNTNVANGDDLNFGFSGPLPGLALGRLINLRVLELYTNRFTGILPPGLGGCISLEVLDLEFNTGIVGPIPASFAKLVNLSEVYLSSTGITGSVPGPFCIDVAPEYFVTSCAVTCTCCSSCLQ